MPTAYFYEVEPVCADICVALVLCRSCAIDHRATNGAWACCFSSSCTFDNNAYSDLDVDRGPLLACRSCVVTCQAAFERNKGRSFGGSAAKNGVNSEQKLRILGKRY